LDPEERVCFGRFTQLSLLRLLTTEAVMGAEVMTQAEAWNVYDLWLSDSRVVFLEEPVNLDVPFRRLSRQKHANPKTWSDSYLAAFATAAGLRFVTFDRAFQGKTPQLLLLRPQAI
jgi:predicted nucleic acid-binding protein